MANIRSRDGKWQARVTLEGRVISKTFTLKADAHRWARQKQVELERGAIDAPPEPCSLGQVIERYIREVLPLKRGRQQEFYLLQQWLRSGLAGIDIGAVRPGDLAEVRDKRLKKVSSGSVRRELDVISAVFTMAMKEWRLCATNPVAMIRKPAPGKARERRLLPGELQRVIDASQSPDFESIVILAYETAMRRGELLGLRWHNIDFKRRLAFLELTKNGESRYVPLSASALRVLEQMPRRADGFVFAKNGTSMSGAFQRAVSRARRAYEVECQETGIDPNPKYLIDLRLHDLRHEATTRLVEMGLSMIEVATITGHKTLSMLMRYSHPDVELLARKIDGNTPGRGNLIQ